ncbi:MAG: aldehyde dehydrogenase family protein [Calditrichia bacterium]|nr:aldehyde dehydrogenase family protein [Calditrichia bacterium]
MPYDFPIFINGDFCKTNDVLEIRSPYDNHLVGRTYRANSEEIEAAIEASVNAFDETKKMPIYERVEKLAAIIDDIRTNKEEFAHIICEEAGKAISTSRGEAERAVMTFTDALEECKRIRGEYLPLDYDPSAQNRWAMIRRFPIGPIFGISPFNFPLNLVCHKVAPALASGNTMILKPASQTPLTALRLAQSVSKAGWPNGSFNVLPMDSKNAHLLLEDNRIQMVTFTGSPAVGWALKNHAGRKRVTLELGGNAGVIIHHDADIEYAASRCAAGGYVQSGQNCISVQRVYAHKDIYKSFMDAFIEKVEALKTGDPAEEETFVGPMIHSAEVKRVNEWLKEATDGGATIVTGGTSKGNMIMPTVLTDVDPKQKISCQEVFAPVVVVYEYTDIEEALGQINDSEYGLQAGLFTKDAGIIFKAYEDLEVGGVIVGDVPTFRVDHMPYGGTKLSGMGREGVRFAIEEMTEMKLLVMNVST